MSTTNMNDASQPANTSSDPGTSPDAAEVTGKHAVPAEPVIGNKEQMHQRVQGRLVELMAAQAQLTGQDGARARVQAIETALQVAQNSMSGGWEHVGQREAAQLSQWLTNTESLTQPRTAEPPAPQG